MREKRFIIVFLVLFVCFLIGESTKKTQNNMENENKAVNNTMVEVNETTSKQEETVKASTEAYIEETVSEEATTIENTTAESEETLGENEEDLFDQIVLNGKVNTFAMKVGAITDNIGGYHSSARMIDCSDKKITFYLGGNYTTLKFNLFYSSEQTELVAGRRLNIIADGNTIKTCKMETIILPTEYVVDVSGVQQLTLEAEYYNYTFHQTGMHEKEAYTDMFTLIK